MTTFHLPTAFFPDNAIVRAERTYQQRSSKSPRRWRLWLNRLTKWSTITIAMIMFGGLFIGSLTQRDPTPIANTLRPLPTLLILFTLFYHFNLIFQTISLTANSIAREKEGQSWEILVLTGVDARQIVRGKWWATVQRQLPHYLLLGLLRAGAISALGLSIATIFYASSSYYTGQLQLPHPITILVSSLFGIALTVANLGLSAASGVMASAVSQRSTMAIARGIANQIVLSLLSGVGLIFLLSRINFIWRYSFYTIMGTAAVSLIDNGYNMTAYPMYADYNYRTDSVTSTIAAIEIDWMIAGLITLALYAVLIWFALWRAEKRAVSALATPVS